MLRTMAPTGRSKKVGLQRIDAAYDALIPFGFRKEQVRKTIRNLLKVYGGDAGWIFIEEACYKLVIDTLLEQQENEGTESMETDDSNNSPALPASEHLSDAVGETSLVPANTSINQDPDELALSYRHGEDESEDIRTPASKVFSNRNEPCKNTRLMQRMHDVDIESSSTEKLSNEPCKNTRLMQRMHAVDIERSSTKKLSNEPCKNTRLMQPMHAVDIERSSTKKFSNEPCKNTRLMQPMRAVDIESSSKPMRAVDIESSSTKKFSNEPASSVTIESSYDQQPIEQPARKRPPCYGWFSETESDSEDGF